MTPLVPPIVPMEGDVSRNSSIHLDMRRWAEHRRPALTAKETAYFVAELLNGLNEPSAREGQHCDVCDDVVVDGKCPTCQSIYIDGKRQLEFIKSLEPFQESCLKCGTVFYEWDEHECEIKS